MPSEQGQRVPCFVEAYGLDVRPVEEGNAYVGHLFRVGQRPNSTNFALPVGSTRLSNSLNEKTGPWNDRTPAFDTAHAIDALLERCPVQDILDGERLCRFDFAIDRYGPRTCAQSIGMLGWAVLVRAELRNSVGRYRFECVGLSSEKWGSKKFAEGRGVSVSK